MALCLLLPPDPRLATAAKIAGKSGKTLMFASCCDIVPTSDVPQRSHFVSGSDTPIGGRNHTIPYQTKLNQTKLYQTIPNHTKPYQCNGVALPSEAEGGTGNLGNDGQRGAVITIDGFRMGWGEG